MGVCVWIVEGVIYGPSVSSTPTLPGLSPSECEGLASALALIRLGGGLSASLGLALSASFLEEGLQPHAGAGVASVHSLEEKVRLLLQPVQVALGAAVLPVELFGSESDVQQARLTQDVVGVAEALPLDVGAALAGVSLRWGALLGVHAGNSYGVG